MSAHRGPRPEEKRPLAEAVTKRRPCLCCDADFESWGAGNRLCARCRALPDHEPSALTVHARVPGGRKR